MVIPSQAKINFILEGVETIHHAPKDFVKNLRWRDSPDHKLERGGENRSRYENPLEVIPYGFDSRLRHQFLKNYKE